MWYLKRLNADGELEQLITCEITPPKFNNAYKPISREEYDFLMREYEAKRRAENIPSDPEILGTVV